jgi:hypothetical protein
MALKSMKRKKNNKEGITKSSVDVYEEPEYPWGLEVNLDDDSLGQLGLKAGDFKIGEGKTLEAKVRVDHISSDKNHKGKDRDSVRMQITDMDLGGSKEAKKSLFENYKAQTDSGHEVL